MGGVTFSRLLALAVAGALALGGAGRAAAAPEGIDVSNWQGRIDWVRVGAAGYTFAFAKASEGTTFRDVTYPLNRAGASPVGIRLGAYHFARPSGSSDAAAVASAVGQADAFLDFAQPQPGDLLPVLDLETTGGLSVPRLTLWTRTWLDEVTARLGVRPIIYASPSFWKQRLGDTSVFGAAGHPLWIAHWTKAALPVLPGGGWGGLGWTFWQWTNCLSVPGIPSRCVDGDRFRGGTLASSSLLPWPSGPPAVAAPPAVVGTPQVGRLLAATAGGWSGGKPAAFSYAWHRCDAAGAGCAPIAQATRRTYTPAAADAGHALVVSVTAASAGGSAAATSAPTVAVAAGGAPGAAAPAATSPPAIEGAAVVGQTLRANAGAWTGSPASFAYQWRRCDAAGASCTGVEGAGGADYTLTPDDAGAAVSVVVTATGRGGAGSAAAPATAVVQPAPVPAAVVGSAAAEPGAAGAVTTADGRAVATWQPGAVPFGARVALAPVESRLALPATTLAIRVGDRWPLRWPVDVRYPAPPPDAVPGFIYGKGVWRPLAELQSPALPPDEQAGAYRAGDGALHVLTRRPGRIALFAAGKWGDPRFGSTTPPRLALVRRLATARRPDGTVLVYGRVTLDAQAHLYASVIVPRGRAVILKRGSRLGWWLPGKPAKTVETLQLRPGALPVRLRIPARQLAGAGRFALRLAAVDAYGRRSTLTVPFAPPRARR